MFGCIEVEKPKKILLQMLYKISKNYNSGVKLSFIVEKEERYSLIFV